MENNKSNVKLFKNINIIDILLSQVNALDPKGVPMRCCVKYMTMASTSFEETPLQHSRCHPASFNSYFNTAIYKEPPL